VPRKPPLEDQLARLADLRSQPPSPEARVEVAGFLNARSNLLAAKAARIAGEWQATELIPELLSAFERFLVKPEVADKGCAAKTEIVKALCKLEHSSPSVFLRGMRHVQMEAVWGPLVDTAAELRGLSAIGLAQTAYPEVLEEILPLLLDPERGARIGAVRAIAACGLPGDALVLRLKALSGDQETEVMGECFAGLLRVEPARSLAFVAAFLHSGHEAVAEAAALALGDARLESAFAILRDAFQQPHSRALRRTLLLAIALLRREPAIDFLLELVRSGEGQASADAAAALAMYDQEPKLRERLNSARASRSVL
jgi:HEAT repeat protein